MQRNKKKKGVLRLLPSPSSFDDLIFLVSFVLREGGGDMESFVFN